MTNDELNAFFDHMNDPQVLWDEDGPPTLEDENLTWKCQDGTVALMGRGGILQDFNPDPVLDAALVEALEAAP